MRDILFVNLSKCGGFSAWRHSVLSPKLSALSLRNAQFFYFKCMFGGGKGQGAAGFLPYQKAFRLALLPAKPTEKRKDFPIKVR